LSTGYPQGRGGERESQSLAVGQGGGDVSSAGEAMGSAQHGLDHRRPVTDRSDRQAAAALGTTGRKDGTTGTRAHTQPETMGLRPTTVVRLVSPLAHFDRLVQKSQVALSTPVQGRTVTAASGMRPARVTVGIAVQANSRSRRPRVVLTASWSAVSGLWTHLASAPTPLIGFGSLSTTSSTTFGVPMRCVVRRKGDSRCRRSRHRH